MEIRRVFEFQGRRYSEEVHRSFIRQIAAARNQNFSGRPELEIGATISPELLAAVEQSRFAVVVLSPNYASSTWCLLELAKIVQCMGQRGTILPIFYEVVPSDVRHQRGSFAEAFGKHEKKFGKDLTKVQKWRDALTKVANLSGWSSLNYR